MGPSAASVLSLTSLSRLLLLLPPSRGKASSERGRRAGLDARLLRAARTGRAPDRRRRPAPGCRASGYAGTSQRSTAGTPLAPPVAGTRSRRAGILALLGAFVVLVVALGATAVTARAEAGPATGAGTSHHHHRHKHHHQHKHKHKHKHKHSADHHRKTAAACRAAKRDRRTHRTSQSTGLSVCDHRPSPTRVGRPAPPPPPPSQDQAQR
jgi:hypothetical protein